jgi:pSer/pThr/pTyr-binding forkhead associated (FHA) protein
LKRAFLKASETLKTEVWVIAETRAYGRWNWSRNPVRGGSVTMLYILSGPEGGRSFKLREGVNFVGRSLDNDVRIQDRTVSRKHVRITKKGDKYFLTDLRSRNGTFFDGAYLAPGSEAEAKEGFPIGIGTSVICLGQGCKKQNDFLQETMEIKKEDIEQSAGLKESGRKNSQERLEFLYTASSLLVSGLALEEALEKILGYLFEVLKRVDRGAFILVDPQTGKIKETVSRTEISANDKGMAYSNRVVERVLKDKRPVVISDVQTEEDELADTLKVSKIECVMCVPMVFGSDIIGVIYVDSRQRPYGFRDSDLSLFMELGQQIALAVEKARFVSEMSKIVDTFSLDD